MRCIFSRDLPKSFTSVSFNNLILNCKVVKSRDIFLPILSPNPVCALTH